jgi:hypothetical protein
MASVYLQPADYASYGLPATLNASLVVRASSLIDTYCRRAIAPTQATEELRLPAGRNRLLLARTPVISVDAAQGRYGYPRRANSNMQVFPGSSLLELSSIFGGPPQWETIDATQVVWDANTGEAWFPAGIFMSQYTDVMVTYTAGYTATPDAIKAACAFLIFAYLERAGLMGAKGGRVTALVSSDHTLINRDIAAMLAPYRVRSMR